MKVLVAVDGGETSERVLAAIAGWAAATSADVHLLTVLHPKDVHATLASRGFGHSLTPQGTASGSILRAEEPPAVAAEDRTQALERVTQETAARLRELVASTLPGVQATMHVEASDKTAEEIVNQASHLGVELIAMGTHGRRGVARAMLGSVAEEVVRNSPVPVLVVGPAMP
ncbi:MAG: universal stress protein [Chloroflexi bacterium]|nr:universal stress protein [Chloroflexota bacterium]